MAIYVNRIVKVAQQLPPAPDGVLNLNCLNWYPNNVMYGINLYEITPYYIHDAEGHLFENLWQFSKVYKSIDAQHEIKAGKVIWSHPAEVHIRDGKYTPEFWNWRKKGWNNKYPVRYPNGYYGRHKCLYALWYENNQWVPLKYIPARKKIYCKIYAMLVHETTAFKQLKHIHDSGQGLQICEMDVRPGLITEEVLRRELNNEKEPFGHGYVLATCLMGLTHIFDE
jgi:hypothetical protein